MCDDCDPRMRFRIWVNGQLMDESWVDTSNPDCMEHCEAIQQHHQRIASAAMLLGGVFMVEMHDPARPEGEDFHRFGTDASAEVTIPRERIS